MIWLLFSTIAVLFVTIGVTYAWFVQNASMTTLMEILPPDSITIIPISEEDGSEMTELDLDYREGTHDFKDDNGTIHIRRPICIKSTNPIHQLEIVHTTNLNHLSFRIYPATKTGQEFSFEEGTYVSGQYINETTNGSGLAEEDILENYKSTTEVADTHAYPLYWLAVNCATSEYVGDTGWQEVTSYLQKEFDPSTKDEKDFYYTYYFLEISWRETTKETDLFYIMAQNVAE